MEPRPFSRRDPEKRHRESKLTIPERVGPHVRLVFSEMKRQAVRCDDVEVYSGVLRSTLKAWRHKNYPSLDSLEAVLAYLGWNLTPLPQERALPPEVVAELRPIAERLDLTMPQTIEALIAIATGISHRALAKAA